MQNIRSSKGTVPVNLPVLDWIFPRSRSLEDAKFEDLVELEPEHFDYLFFRNQRFTLLEKPKISTERKTPTIHQTSYLTFWGTDVLFQWACFCSSGRSIFIVENELQREKKGTVSFSISYWYPCNTMQTGAKYARTSCNFTKWAKCACY